MPTFFLEPGVDSVYGETVPELPSPIFTAWSALPYRDYHYWVCSVVCKWPIPLFSELYIINIPSFQGCSVSTECPDRPTPAFWVLCLFLIPPQSGLCWAYVFLKQLNLYSCKREVWNNFNFRHIVASSTMWFPGWVLIKRGKVMVEWVIRGHNPGTKDRQMTDRQTANLSYLKALDYGNRDPSKCLWLWGYVSGHSHLRKHCTCRAHLCDPGWGLWLSSYWKWTWSRHGRLWIPFLRVQIWFLETLLVFRFCKGANRSLILVRGGSLDILPNTRQLAQEHSMTRQRSRSSSVLRNTEKAEHPSLWNSTRRNEERPGLCQFPWSGAAGHQSATEKSPRTGALETHIWVSFPSI